MSVASTPSARMMRLAASSTAALWKPLNRFRRYGILAVCCTPEGDSLRPAPRDPPPCAQQPACTPRVNHEKSCQLTGRTAPNARGSSCQWGSDIAMAGSGMGGPRHVLRIRLIMNSIRLFRAGGRGECGERPLTASSSISPPHVMWMRQFGLPEHFGACSATEKLEKGRHPPLQRLCSSALRLTQSGLVCSQGEAGHRVVQCAKRSEATRYAKAPLIGSCCSSVRVARAMLHRVMREGSHACLTTPRLSLYVALDDV